MAITQTQILQLCVSMFNAAPDAANLASINGWVTNNPTATTADLAAALGENSSFTTLYSGTVAENVTLMLSNFGLTSADTVANDYFTTQLTAGVDKATLLNAANNYLLNTDAATLATNGLTNAKATLDNKATVAEYYAVTKAVTATTFAELQAALSGVDETTASVTTANTAIDTAVANSSIDGTTFTLTTSADPVVGTANNDLINAATGTLETGDLISDASSTDSDILNATFTAADITANPLPTVTGIENINIDIDAFAGTATTLDATNITSATITLSSDKLGFDGQAGVEAALTNNIVAGTNVTNFTVAGLTTGSVDAGSATTISVDATATSTLDLTVNSNVTAATFVGTQKDTNITATADATVTLAAGATFGTATDVDGAGSLTIKGAGADLTTETITNSGTGTLSINISDDDTADLSNVASSDVTLSVAAGFTDTLTLNNNASTVTATGIGAATIVVDSTDTTETLTINTSDTTIGAVDLDDIETTSLVLGADTTITALEGEGTLNISGTADVIMTSAAAGSDMAVVDASALTGKLNYTTVTGSTQTVKGGSGKATLTTSTDDIVTFEALNGGSSVTSNTTTGTLSVESGSGADTVIVKALTAGGKIVGTLGTGDDILKFSDLATEGIDHSTAQINIAGGTGDTDNIIIQNSTDLGTISALSSITGFETLTLGGTVADATAATTAEIAALMVSGTDMELIGTANADSLTITGLAATAQTIDLSDVTFSATKAIETVAITGSSVADTITGFSGVTGIATSYTIDAGAGNDTIIAGTSSSASTITSGAGDDSIDLTDATGVNTLMWTAGKDTVTGWGATDILNLEAAAGSTGNVAAETAISVGAAGTAVTTSAIHILSTNGTAANLTTGGTATVTDWTDVTDVAAYLEERFNSVSGEDAVFVINDTTTSAYTTYVYDFDNGANTTIVASELSLIGVISNGGVGLSVANTDFTA